MNIDFVVVDKLPMDCWHCPKHVYFNDSGLYCRVKGLYVKNGSIRPEICPLLTYDQAFDLMIFERPATIHMKERIAKELGVILTKELREM